MSGPNYLKAIGKGRPAAFGRPPGPRPAKARLVSLYVRKGLSLRATAEALGLSKDTTQRSLRAYGIRRRSKATPPKLNPSDLSGILTERWPPKSLSRETPWPAIAKRHGVSLKTLQRFIKAAGDRNVTPRTLSGRARRKWQRRQDGLLFHG